MTEWHSLLQLCEELPSFFFFFLCFFVFFTAHTEAAGLKGTRCLMQWPGFSPDEKQGHVCLILQQEGRKRCSRHRSITFHIGSNINGGSLGSTIWKQFRKHLLVCTFTVIAWLQNEV